MQPRYSFAIVFILAILVVILGLTTADSASSRIDPMANRPSDTQTVQAEGVVVQVKDRVLSTATAEPAVSVVTLPEDQPSIDGPSMDGPSLLRHRCAQCHFIQLFEQSGKPRADWEKTLSRMEKFGVRLSDTERAVLLDYLAKPDES